MADVYGIRPWEIDDMTPSELEAMVEAFKERKPLI